MISSKYIYVILVALLLTSCGPKKTEFNGEELDFIDTYQVGDTLVFKSEHDEYNTMTIVHKQVYYPEYIPIEVHGKYLPQTADIRYSQPSRGFDSLKFMTMRKRNPKESSLYFGFNGGMELFFTNSEIGLGLDEILIGDTFVFEMNEQKEGRVQTIYWHKDKGIAKYIMVDGTVWNRIN
ncbi:hypothetical protein GCM10011340_36020 [Roseivirga thermotolerans]|uniref:Lipoprotein n=1 Tax=Roseivirga thermotolerans TaxID=1758176 RepID=A0ABQ3I9U3_9BACT|nr:hypothetical protein GCM10011340_36020 [Roseivirga thermotolerans]